MKLMNLLEDLKFGNKDPRAEPLHADTQDRVILFTLKPDQPIREHQAPSSPFFVVILKGKGIFASLRAVMALNILVDPVHFWSLMPENHIQSARLMNWSL